MSAIITADWVSLDKDKYFRKFDLYTMNWSVESGLDTMIVAGAPYGGPIALIRDRNQLVRIVGSAKPVIHIYNCAGTHLANIVWNNGTLVHMGWSDGEQLLCIQESGEVFVYDMFGNYQHTFSMGPEASDTKVYKAKIFPNPHGTGIGIQTASNRMFVVNNVTDPKVRKLPDLPRGSEGPNCWCVLSSGYSGESTSSTKMLVCREKDVYCCTLGEMQPIQLRPDIVNPYTAILKITASQNGRHVAMFTNSGFIWMGQCDMRKYCEIDTGFTKTPKQMFWCNVDAVICHWDTILMMIGKSGDKVSYSYDYPIHLIPEIDCVRVVSGITHELIQKVPITVQKIFRINSTEPASYLLEASKQFQKRSHRADEYICIVKNQLPTAVQDCIDAAAFEFDPEIQKMLIRAAQFGKGFISDHNPDHYVHVCRWLRVLNSIRDPKVGIPLTYLQSQHLKEILLDRLVSRRLHCLAKHIATYLKLSGHTRVLAHWACYKVSQTHVYDDSIAKEIAEKLRNVPGVSYTDIALKAADKGRTALAIKILEYEPQARKQIPLLLKLGEQKTALLKATQSGDTDLIYVVLFNLQNTMVSRDFHFTIRAFPVAQNLYMKYYSEYNRETLCRVYVQEDNFQGQAATHIKHALSPSDQSSMEASMNAAKEAYRKGKNELGVAICDDIKKLIKQLSSLRESHGSEFNGTSVHDTLYKLLLKNEIKLAEKIKAEFKVPERRFWWLRIQALAEIGKWDELENFSKTKKSPIGFEPFVDVCLKHKNKIQCEKYLPKCREDIKVKYYVKAEFYEKAAEIAFEQKDEGALLFVQSKCPVKDSLSHNKINNLLQQLPRK